MSRAAIEAFDAAARRLRSAMESGDAEKTETALGIFAAALKDVQGIGALRSDPETKELLRDLRQRLDSDQHLARLLADLAGQQIERIAGIAPDTAPQTYKPRK